MYKSALHLIDLKSITSIRVKREDMKKQEEKLVKTNEVQSNPYAAKALGLSPPLLRLLSALDPFSGIADPSLLSICSSVPESCTARLLLSLRRFSRRKFFPLALPLRA